jgi:leucyl-tRNA synthetase
VLVASGEYTGMKTAEARERIIVDLAEKGVAEEKANYRLRDWIFSRQHYWGEPIPIIHCEKDGAVPVPDDQLPVELPHVENYEPTDTGESPLAAVEEWVNTTCPKCGGPARRETDTMPNWAGSSWYYLRYYDARNDAADGPR